MADKKVESVQESRRHFPITVYCLLPFMLCALSICFFVCKTSFPLLIVSLLACLGTVCSFAYRLTGVVASSALLGVVSYLYPEKVFPLFFASIFVTWMLSSLCKRELDAIFQLQRQSEEQGSAKIEQLESQLKTRELFYLEEKKKWERAIDAERKEIERWQSSLDKKQLELEIVLEQKVALEKELSITKQQVVSLGIELQENKVRLLEKEKQRQELHMELQGREEKIEELSAALGQVREAQDKGEVINNFELMYKQMRMQFDEKSLVLKETRKELFYTENALLALRKQVELDEGNENEESCFFICQIKELEEERFILEEQVEQLQNVVSSLLIQSKETKLKRVRKKKTEATLPLDDLLEVKMHKASTVS